MLKSLRKKILISDFFSINKIVQNIYQVDILQCLKDSEILISKTPDSILNPNYLIDDPNLKKNKKNNDGGGIGGGGGGDRGDGESTTSTSNTGTCSGVEFDRFTKFDDSISSTKINKFRNLRLREYKEYLTPRISIDDFYNKLQNIAIVIDIRNKEEFDEYHIPNSINCEDNQSILDLVKYKSGLPIVIVSSFFEIENEENQKFVNSIELFLLENSFHFVSGKKKKKEKKLNFFIFSFTWWN